MFFYTDEYLVVVDVVDNIYNPLSRLCHSVIFFPMRSVWIRVGRSLYQCVENGVTGM